MTHLPPGWYEAALHEVCAINPRVDKEAIDANDLVSFVPMSAVEAGTGNIDLAETRAFDSVRKGYTPFRKGDVLFAKITPCMENGKMAIVPDMVSEYGFGSTEFHVLRPAYGVDPRFIYYTVSERAFRHHAEHNMTGAVGQKRVPAVVLQEHRIGLPPAAEQRRIADGIEAQFDEIDRGVESLRDAKRAIGLYRQSLLKSAFEGHLTADWRAKNPDKLESPDALLARIREERETRFELALEEWERSVDEWQKSGKTGRRPVKPKRPERPEMREAEDLQELPSGWFYLSLNGLVRSIRNGIAVKPDEIGALKIFRISAVRPMAFDLNDFRRITDPDGRMEHYRLKYGDLLFTRYNGSRDYVGVSAMYRGDGTHVHPDKLIRCQVESNIINSAYLEAATNCGESRSHIEKRIRTTAGQSGVSGTDLKTMPVPICSPAEQAEIVRILDTRLQAIEAVDKEIDANFTRAESLRQSILKQAFSGKLVPQDPKDEPATELLARIQASRNGPTAKPRKPARKRAAAQPP